MVAVCCYFQVHQPFRLAPGFDYFAIGTGQPFEDEATNRKIMRKVAENCYLPANALLLEQIERTQGRFRVAFSISGTALEQFELYDPRVLQSFRRLVATGCVELLGETYYHSLASVFSDHEFRRQVRQHRVKVRDLFGVTPKVFRNTELIYSNHIAEMVEQLGFRGILAEGADRLLGWRSPNYVYRPPGMDRLAVLLKNYRLSDDVAFRFSSRDWQEWPLTAEKYAGWLHRLAGEAQTVNLFMDYETFGEHQWASTGIFDFLRHLPEGILAHPDFLFLTPSEVVKRCLPVGEIDSPSLVSWADSERDVSAWLGNHMQDGAAAAIYAMEKDVISTREPGLVHAWRKLQTSDHFYYMCTKFFADGDVHKYFSPYESPYDAFIHYANALNQLKWLCEAAHARRREKLRRSRPKPPAVRPRRELAAPRVQKKDGALTAPRDL